MADQLAGQPVYILKEGAERILGRDAKRMNIMAANVIANAVKTTLGPKGMDKMLVDSSGNAVITNDGAAILKEVDVKHPAAKMMVEIAKTVEKEAGDGTTSAVVIAGELLKKAEGLLDQNVHPAVIAKGYRIAEEKALKIVDEIAKKADPGDKEILNKLAVTALNSKASGITAKEHIAKLAVDAVSLAAEKSNGKIRIDKDDIKIVKQVGEATGASELVRGIILDKERVHPGMPRVVKNAKIALLDTELKIKKSETDAKINITSPEQVQMFVDEEEKTIKEMVEQIARAGANVLFCRKDVEDLAQYLLMKKGILAVKSISEKDMKLLAKATGGKVAANTNMISSGSLGKAKTVESKKVGDEEYIFVEGCAKPRAVTIFVRGATEPVVDEIERSLDDAISVVRDAMEDGSFVVGGGASMMEIVKELRKFANSIGGREQLAVIEFANALEVVPRALAENAGLDPIDAIMALRAAHENGDKNAGVELKTGKPKDMLNAGIVEPTRVRKQAIKSGAEVAMMVLRIDDIIAAKGALGGEEEEKPTPPAPPGGSCPAY